MRKPFYRMILPACVAGLAACGQTGPLVLPEHSPAKQGYLLVDKKPPGTVVTPAPAPEKPTAVPTPTTPFPPPEPTSPRSPLANTNTP